MGELETAFNSIFSSEQKAHTEKLAFVCEFDFSYFLSEFISNSFKKENKDGVTYAFDLRFTPYKGVNKLALITESSKVNPLLHFAKELSIEQFDNIDNFSVICSQNSKRELNLFLRKNESPRGLKSLNIHEKVDICALFSKKPE